MKKTLFKIMGLALTVAMLASLIIGVIPVSASSVGTPTATLSSTTISAVAKYDISLQTSAFGALNAPAPAAASAAAFAVNAGDTLQILTACNLTFTSADAGLLKNGVLTAVAAGGVVAAIVGDVFNIGVANTITPSIAIQYYKNAVTGGGVITVVLPAGTTIPTYILNAKVLIGINGVGAVTDAMLVAAEAVATVPAAGIIYIAKPAAVAGTVGNVRVVIGATVGVPIVTAAVLTNPATSGSYTLSVSTNADTTPVASVAYTIGVPGNIQVYNSVGAYLGTFSTFQALNAAGVVAAYTSIKVGPGVYVIPDPGLGFFAFTIAADYVTLTSTSPGVVIIGAINVNGNYDTLSSFVHAGGNGANAAAVTVNGDSATISGVIFGKTNQTTATPPSSNENGLLVVAAGADLLTVTGGSVDTSSPSGYWDTGLVLAGTNAKISGLAFKTDQTAALAGDTAINNSGVGNTIDACTFTGVNGGFGVVNSAVGVTIKNSTFTGLQTAINTSSNATISSNTISGCITNGVTYVGAIVISGGVVNASGNTIKTNTGYSFQITGIGANSQIGGNNMSGNVKGFTSAVAVNAVLNYWGAVTGPLNTVTNPTGTGDIVSANVTYKPFLGVLSSAAASYIGTAGPDNFDASILPAGFMLSGYTGGAGSIVVGQKLSANPKTIDPDFTAVQYFDIYTSVASTTAMQIRLYAAGLTSNSQVYFWSALLNNWVLCSSQGVAGTGDFVYVNVNATSTPTFADLVGTPFVVVQGLPPVPPAFVLLAPAANATTALTNVPFTWNGVAGATKYEIIVSVNGDLSKPDVDKFTTGTGYTVTASLTAGVPYFWQIVAWQNNDFVIARSQTGTFTPMAPPTTTSTPIITITTQPAPTITFTNPPSTVITIPPVEVTQITPAWIWGIIGIGAVLVIVVIVLIVRTRRSA